MISDTPVPQYVNPNSLAPGTTGDNVYVSGQDFMPGATVTMGAGITVVSVSYESAGYLLVSVNVSSTAKPGSRNVTVTNHPSSGAKSGTFQNALTVS